MKNIMINYFLNCTTQFDKIQLKEVYKMIAFTPKGKVNMKQTPDNLQFNVISCLIRSIQPSDPALSDR